MTSRIMNILLFFDNILFAKFKNDSSVFDFTNMRSLWQRDVLCKIHTHIVWAQEQFLQWSFK